MYLLPNTHKKVFILHTYYLGRYIISVQSENWHRSSLLKTNKQITHSSSMFTRNWKKENSICERLGLPTKVWIHNAIELKLATYLEYILRIRVFHFHHLIGSYRLEWWKFFYCKADHSNSGSHQISLACRSSICQSLFNFSSEINSLVSSFS